MLGEVLHEELLQDWQGTKVTAFGSPVMSAPPLHAGGEGAACRPQPAVKPAGCMEESPWLLSAGGRAALAPLWDQGQEGSSSDRP